MIVTRNGKPVAALLAVRDDEDLERLILGHSAHLRTILESARQQISEGAGIGHEDFWKNVEEKKPAKRRSKRSGKTS